MASSGMHSCPLQQMNPAQHPSKTQVSGLMHGGSVGTGCGKDGPVNPRRAALASCTPTPAMAMPPSPRSPFSIPRRLVPNARLRAIVSSFRSSIELPSAAPERECREDQAQLHSTPRGCYVNLGNGQWRTRLGPQPVRVLFLSPHFRSPLPIAYCLLPCLLPLDRGRRLRRDVVDHAVDAMDFVDDAVAHAGQHLVGN